MVGDLPRFEYSPPAKWENVVRQREMWARFNYEAFTEYLANAPLLDPDLMAVR